MTPVRLWNTRDVAIRLGFERPDGAPDRKRAHAYLVQHCKSAMKFVGRSVRVEPAALEATLERRVSL